MDGERFDKLPPASMETEQCLLASLMLSQRDEFDQVRMLVNRDYFFQADHQIIFQALCEMRQAGKAVDIITVRNELAGRGMLEEVGGSKYLGELLRMVPSSAHGKTYATTVRELALRRAGIGVANEILRACYEPRGNEEAVQFLSVHASKLASIAATGKVEDVHWMEEIVSNILDRQKSKKSRKVMTGILDLDSMTGGMPIGGYTIIGANARVGKSLLGKDILRRIARRGVKCGIVSIEESCEKIGENMISAEGSLANNKLSRNLPLDDEDGRRLAAGAGKASELPIAVIDSVYDIEAIEAAIISLGIRHGCQVVFVDHFHAIPLNRTKGRTETEIQSEMSGVLKRAFKRLNVVGIVASQLNKPSADFSRPTERDLRGSGSLFFDADLVMLLYREDLSRMTEPGFKASGIMEIIVVKNKDDEMGTVKVRFDGEHQRVTDYAEEPFGDVTL